MTRAPLLLLTLSALAAGGCMSLDYDLAAVPIPISAQPAGEGVPTEPITIEATHVLYAHGLLGEREPDVAWMINLPSNGYSRITGFRLTHGATFHDWLLTHLSLTLLRFKSITIEMERVR